MHQTTYQSEKCADHRWVVVGLLRQTSIVSAALSESRATTAVLRSGSDSTKVYERGDESAGADAGDLGRKVTGVAW